MKKYRLNVNGEIYRYISYEEATKLINYKVKTEYDWFYLYEENDCRKDKKRIPLREEKEKKQNENSGTNY